MMRRLDNIDIRLLRVFVTLADANGFADAQIVLNLSQPTLSTHLAELEKRLGGRLCDRGRKQFRLTELGKATYEAASRLFLHLDEFAQRVAQAKGGLSGRLRIGVSDGIFTSPKLGIQDALARFMQPDIDVFIDLALGTPADLEQQIVSGERDVVIGPFSHKAPGLIYIDFHSEPHMLYCGERHPLFSRIDTEISRREIEEARFSVRGYRHLDDIYLVRHPKASASVVHMEAQLMMILSGSYIGFLPCHFADPHVENGRLRPIKPAMFSFSSLHRIAYRQQNEASALVRAFVNALIG